MTESLRQKIARELAVSVDGIENNWEDFLPDADVCLRTIKESISPLLTKKSEANLRLSLGDLLGLKITFAPASNDPKRKVCPEVPSGLSSGHRTIRRRSSASNKVYELRYGSQSVFRSSQREITRMPNRPNLRPFS